MTNGYYSIGDKLLEGFDLWTDTEAKLQQLQKVLEEEYTGKDVLIMDLVTPYESFGFHSFDIRTLRCPDNSVQVSAFHFNTD